MTEATVVKFRIQVNLSIYRVLALRWQTIPYWAWSGLRELYLKFWRSSQE